MRCATIATPDPRKQRTMLALLASARPRMNPARRSLKYDAGFP